jgi:tRNA nucleotidyltransferase/poly(A) polymerase
MLNKNSEYIAKKIINHGGDCYIVGGAVRDFVRGVVPHDVDIASSMNYNDLLDIFKKDHPVIVGSKWGVMIIRGIEVSVFRSDVYDEESTHNNGADSVVAASTIQEDLERRDFRFNAMAIKINPDTHTLSTDVIDPFGGMNDIAHGVINFVGDPDKRIIEDPCRILRALRFASTLGYTIGDGSKNAINRHYKRVLIISKERIREELVKALKRSFEPSVFINLLLQYNLLGYVIPGLEECYAVEQNEYHAEDVYEHCLAAMDSVSPKYWRIRLAALMHDIGKPQCVSIEGGKRHFFGHEYYGSKIARDAMQSLRFSTDDIKYVTELIRKHMYFFEEETRIGTYRTWLNNLGVPVRDLLRLRIADRRGNKKKIGIPRKFKMVLKRIREIEWDDKQIKLKHLYINGNDIKKIGVPEGPVVGKLLSECLKYVILNPSRNTREELLSYVRSLVGVLDNR